MDASTGPASKGQRSDAPSVTARKLKKRELDRKAQRLARERTKNRINELESLVEQLKADSANPEVSNLMASLNRVTQQRNELQNVIQSIDQTIQRCFRQQGSFASSSQGLDAGLGQADALPNDQGKLQPTDGESSPNAPGVQPQSASEAWQQLLPDNFQSSVPVDADMQHTPGPLPATTEGWNMPGQPTTEMHHHSCPQSEDIIVPQPEWPCDCVQSHTTNIWRDANTALGKSTMLSAAQLAIEDFTSEDTPVRVILDGWDSVAKSGKMSLSWKKLRAIDQACFATCGDVERLGILRTMHLLLTYHGNPSQERCEKVPRWLWTRPSQMLPHSYAIDFFVWPGLRERFIFGQHRYCTNIFWKLFRHSLRLSCQLDLKDCYQVDGDTGRYAFSTIFDNYLRDINTWRMTTDFFSEFPELVGDIPVFGSMSPSMPWSRAERACYARIAEREHEQQAAKHLARAGLQDDEAALPSALVPTSGYEPTGSGGVGGSQGLSVGVICTWPSV